MNVAVIGAGIQGCSIALELSRRGHLVDLYEKGQAPFGRASGASEGKLHLGFVYGNDPSYRTVETVLRGSLSFAPLLRRWMDFTADTVPLSEPFIYPVHRDSLLSETALDAHVARVTTKYAELVSGGEYIGSSAGPAAAKLRRAEVASLFDPDLVQAAYRTVERSVDPEALAKLFVDAIETAPDIRLHAGCHVTAATASDDGRIDLTIERGGEATTERYDRVANAAWEGLVALDQSFGVVHARPWLHRYKVGFWIRLREPLDELPSATFVLGPFGDVVNFAGRYVYVSWYPSSMTGSSAAPTPPDFGAQLDETACRRLFDASFGALAALVPALAHVRGDLVAGVTMRGGIIFAWGRTDIDDVGSELHSRHDVGPRAYGSYVSVNTGRYCTAPLFAMKACDMLVGEES